MGSLTPSTFILKSGDNAVIRSATPADAQAILDCAHDVFSTSTHTLTQADEFRLTLQQEQDFLAARLAAPDEVFLIAVPEPPRADPSSAVTEVWGMLGLSHPKPKRKLRHIVELGMGLRSTHRSIGLGSALLAAAVRFAQSRPNLELVTLGVYADNAAGLALYNKFGFVQYGFLPGGCKHDDNSRWDQIEMYKPLLPK